MKRLCILLAVVAIAVVPLRASDPVGAYTIVDKVVLEPNATEPTSAQIFGVFSFAVPRAKDFSQPWPPGSFGTPNTGDVYAAVQKGYVYYTCPKGKEATCAAEWTDLKSLAGKGEVVGFGTRWAMTGRVRLATEVPTSPDVWPLNMGVVKMGNYRPTGNTNRSQYPDLIAALEAASKSK
jgi:hypothetical protein